MKIEQKFDGREKREWYQTYQISRIHSIIWPLLLFHCCVFSYFVSWSILNEGIFSVAFLFAFIMFVISLWANFIGLHSMYLCKKFQIDYRKNWSEV